jgi:WD40 repeat protein
MTDAVDPPSSSKIVSSSFRKCDLLGGPITAVAWDARVGGGFHAGQGPHLRRTSAEETSSLLVFPEGGVIHGIRHVDLGSDSPLPHLLLLFGGRRLAFVANERVCRIEPIEPQPNDDNIDNLLSPSKSSWIDFPDWIWQVLSRPRGLLVVGLASAGLQVLQVTATDAADPPRIVWQRQHRIRGNHHPRSIAYCLDVWTADDSSRLWIAQGHATHEICLWSTTTTEAASSSTPPPLSLRGHTGVLHAVRFHASGRYLASTSDDRTVRLWEESSDQEGDWSRKWTAYGHTARGWDVAFCQFHHEDDDIASSTVVLSTGEDGTLRIWDMHQGAALAVLRGHSCQCIWRVACLDGGDGQVITGGNNGTVARYQLRDVIPSHWFLPERTSTANYGRWQSTFSIPIDSGSSAAKEQVENASKSNGDGTRIQPPRSRPKKSKTDQVVVGMKLVHHGFAKWPVGTSSSSSSNQTGPQLILATRAGSVWHLQVPTGVWTALEPWRRRSDTVEASLGDGCCLSVHPQRPVAAVGTVSGDIVLLSLRQPQGDATGDDPVHPPVILSSAREHRSVQNMKWIEPDQLVSFHVQAIAWWMFPKLERPAVSKSTDVADDNACFTEYRQRTLRIETKGLPICSAWDAARSRLVLGDTRGNLTLFHLNDRASSVIAPTCVLRECHQKEHVTDVLWKNETTIVSVGNDGRIVHCSVDQNGCMCKLMAVPLGPFTGISMIWNISSSLSTQLIAGGYHGNHFAVVDVSTGYEFFRIDTGGRQRIIDVGRHDTNTAAFPESWIVATCVNQSDGHNDIEIHGLKRDSGEHGIVSACPLLHSVGIPLHGESIFDIHLFPIDAVCRTVAILTGSEDCSARITLFRDDRALHSILLPLQVSGIRAVRSCRYNATSTIVVLGGKSAVDLYLVQDIADSCDSVDDLNIRFVGNGAPVEKILVDQRINCIGCVVIQSESDEPAVVVLSGDSSGSCYLYCFLPQFVSSGRLFYQDCRPILCLEILQHYDWSIVVLGETSGDVVVLTLNHRSVCTSILEEPQTPLFRYKAHSMGTNSLTLCLIDETPDGHCVVRIGSCGDDQAVYCTDIDLLIDGAGEISSVTALNSCKVQNAAVSALKGIEFMSHDLFVVTGYDQRLSLWRHSAGFVWSKLDDVPIDVGDVNCLAASLKRNSQHVIAVGGAGVEMLSLSIL